MTKQKQVVLVTGASVGLGLQIAKDLIQGDRYHLILTSRSASRHRFGDEQILRSPTIWIRDLDVSKNEQIDALLTEIDTKLGGVDILINNAGISERSTVEDSGYDYRLRQISVNYLGPFELIARVLPGMREKRRGHIINISSSGGFMAMPTMSAYSASKFALEAASEALWYEMRPWGIKVTLVVPGFINSEGYLNTSETHHSHEAALDSTSTYFEHYKGMGSLVLGGMKRTKSTNQSVSEAILRVINRRNPPLRVFVTIESWILFWVRKVLPPTLYHWFIFKMLPNHNHWGLQSLNSKE